MARQQNFLLLALLAFYCLPYIWLAVYSLYIINFNPSQRIDAGAMLTVVTHIARDPAAYTNIIHQMIMPILAVITAAGHRRTIDSSAFPWIFVLPLVTVVACLLNAVMFDLFSIVTDPTMRKMLSQFFLNSAGNLSVYVMLLVGLKVGGRSISTQE